MIHNPDVLRRECTQLLATGTRREVLFAAAPGTVWLSATVPLQGDLMIPVWQGRVTVVMPPIVLSSLPRMISARLTRQGSYANPAVFGAKITRSDLKTLTAGDIIGFDGFALVTLDGFEYPVVTTNGGQTWRVAGIWFAGPWADAGAFTSQMVTFSKDVAVSYDQSGDLYTTTDAGKRWYAAPFPSMIMSLTPAPTNSKVRPATPFVLIVRMGPRGPVVSQYRSIDGGRHWLLI
jgi:hypothetical protein